MDVAIELSEVHKHFGATHALRGVSLRVPRGEILALLGANGAGKSTTLSLLLGFEAPTQGRAAVFGLDCQTSAAEVRARTAYVPEQVALYPSLTALETLRYLLEVARQPASDSIIEEALSRVTFPLAEAKRPVGSYSKGMRQKVALALALARRCEVLLLDEPTSGLDPSASNELSAVIRELAKGGTTVLMATHDLFRAREDAARVAILAHGRVARVLDTQKVDPVALERIYLEHLRS
jgi:ABC-2 type transport system ATP-binding protein